FSCMMFGFARLMSMGPSYPEPTAQGLVIAVVFLAVTFLFFPALLHFCLIFPRRRPILDRHPEVLRWIYVLPAATVLLLGSFTALAMMMAGSQQRRRRPRTDLELHSVLASAADRVSEYRTE